MMETAGLHPGVEMRLKLLRTRIAELRREMMKVSDFDVERIDDRIEIEALERRYNALEERLRVLNLEGAGFRSAVKSGMAQVAYDLTSSLEGLVKWIDSTYRAGNRSARSGR